MTDFSVVIAAFNAEKWIVPTIRSALNQTHRDFEIIVIGDGCTDRTGDVLESTFGNAIRWKNLCENTGGQSYPNNVGIGLSRGSHVAYLGHDDIWSPRHLEKLDDVIHTDDPDFAVSGAVFHGPVGSRYYQITGLFDDPKTAEREFFPPSSFAHRRDVVDRIGFWRAADDLRAPADCDFLLRAVEHKCSFASTRTVTVHKFAAGHRYLSYRYASAAEQWRMLERLSEDGGDLRVMEEVEKDIAGGADNPPITYPDFGDFRAGDLFRRNRRIKGLKKSAPIKIDGPRWFPVDSFAAALDWYAIEENDLGPFRWSGPNPHPRFLVNVRTTGPVRLAIHVMAFATTELAEALKLDVDEREVAFTRSLNSAGIHVLAVGPIALPIADGLVLRFRLPHCALVPNDARRMGLALRGVEITPLLGSDTNLMSV